VALPPHAHGAGRKFGFRSTPSKIAGEVAEPDSLILSTRPGKNVSSVSAHLTPSLPSVASEKSVKNCSSPRTPPIFAIPIGIPCSFARLISRHAEYVASEEPKTSTRLASSIAFSTAVFTAPGMDSPNMMTAGFNMPAVDLDFGVHAPSLSTSTVVPSGGLFKHTGHAGYRNVEYSTPGTSTSRRGLFSSLSSSARQGSRWTGRRTRSSGRESLPMLD